MDWALVHAPPEAGIAAALRARHVEASIVRGEVELRATQTKEDQICDTHEEREEKIESEKTTQIRRQDAPTVPWRIVEPTKSSWLPTEVMYGIVDAIGVICCIHASLQRAREGGKTQRQ